MNNKYLIYSDFCGTLYDNIWREKDEALRLIEQLNEEAIEMDSEVRYSMLPKTKNTIVSIGYTGVMKCYLNVPLNDAIKRYCDSENISVEDFEEDMDLSVYEIEFDDEFGAYQIWQ